MDEVLGLQGHSHLDATPSRPLGTLNPQEEPTPPRKIPSLSDLDRGGGSGRRGSGLGRGERGGLGEEGGFRGRGENARGRGRGLKPVTTPPQG